MRRITTIIAACVAFALAAGACGDDSAGGSTASADNPLVAAIAAEIMAEDSPMTSDQGEAECFAGRIVGGVGEARMTELGVTPGAVGDIEDLDFTDAEYDIVIDGLFDCVDLAVGMAASIASDGVPAEDAKCVAEALPESLMRDLFSASLRGTDEPPDALFSAIASAYGECGVVPQ